MMKKRLAVLVALTCAICMTACGGGSKESTQATSGTADTDSAKQELADAVESTMTAVEDTVNEMATEMAGAIDDTKIIDYATFAAADIDEPVVVETYVQAKQIWWQGATSLYTQNKDGAYFIYNIPMTMEEYEKLVPGTRIFVSGYKSEWSGEVEITDAKYEIVEGESFIAEPVDITDMLGSDDLINYQNQYFSVKDMQVVASKDAEGNEVAYIYNWDGSGTEGDDLYFNVSKGGADDPVYTFTVESNLSEPGSEVYEAVKALEIGQTVDMDGYLYWYEGANPHVVSVTVK